MFVCCECCVLSGRGLCDGLITRPEESYRLWRVVVCDQETTKILVNEEEAKAHQGAIAPRERERVRERERENCANLMLQLRDTHSVAWKAYVISRVIRHSVHTSKNTPHLCCKRTLLSVKRNTCLLF